MRLFCTESIDIFADMMILVQLHSVFELKDGLNHVKVSLSSNAVIRNYA